MTKKHIEISVKDISAIEKSSHRARLVKAPEHFISQELIADINANGLN
jgi:sulfane dehydrogenase subunit SoxC